MVHSTRCNTPDAATYLNYWNQLHPGVRQVCVHVFIGKLIGNKAGTYQALPWDTVVWAIENVLLKGNDTGDLMLRSPITREQFCVMLKREG